MEDKLTQALSNALDWLKVSGYEVFKEKAEATHHLVYGRKGLSEIVVSVETNESVKEDAFLDRHQNFARWRDGKKDRWVALFVPRGYDPADIVPMSLHDQVVMYPMESLYRS